MVSFALCCFDASTTCLLVMMATFFSVTSIIIKYNIRLDGAYRNASQLAFLPSPVEPRPPPLQPRSALARHGTGSRGIHHLTSQIPQGLKHAGLSLFSTSCLATVRTGMHIARPLDPRACGVPLDHRVAAIRTHLAATISQMVNPGRLPFLLSKTEAALFYEPLGAAGSPSWVACCYRRSTISVWHASVLGYDYF